MDDSLFLPSRVEFHIAQSLFKELLIMPPGNTTGAEKLDQRRICEAILSIQELELRTGFEGTIDTLHLLKHLAEAKLQDLNVSSEANYLPATEKLREGIISRISDPRETRSMRAVMS